jgi:threonine dehydrogenase-like Zn-dependent dehydrogenase
VLAADFSPTRRRLAEAFGADEVIDPAENPRTSAGPTSACPRTSWSGSGASMLGGDVKDPVIFEAVGVPGMLQSLIADAPPHSRIVVVGVCMHSDTIEPFMAVTKEIELRFSFGYTPPSSPPPWPASAPACPAPTSSSPRPSTWPAPPAPSRPCAHPGEHGKILVHP